MDQETTILFMGAAIVALLISHWFMKVKADADQKQIEHMGKHIHAIERADFLYEEVFKEVLAERNMIIYALYTRYGGFMTDLSEEQKQNRGNFTKAAVIDLPSGRIAFRLPEETGSLLDKLPFRTGVCLSEDEFDIQKFPRLGAVIHGISYPAMLEMMTKL